MFHRGYPYNVIVSLLEKQGHKMHLRTLKRKHSDLRLRRKGNNFKESEIELLIRREVEGVGRLAGYRNIWHTLRLRHHIHVPCSLVACFACLHSFAFVVLYHKNNKSSLQWKTTAQPWLQNIFERRVNSCKETWATIFDRTHVWRLVPSLLRPMHVHQFQTFVCSNF